MTEKEESLPELIKNRIDLKSLTAGVAYDFMDLLHQDGKLRDHKVTFYTTIGVVTGKWLPVDENEPDNYKDIENFHDNLFKIRDSRIKEAESDVSHLTNDTGSIPLVNVTIQPYNSIGKHNLSYFLLFADQVVGITIGKQISEKQV